MKNFTSRKAIVYLTLVSIVSTMMAVNSVAFAGPAVPPDDTKYVSPTFTNLNVGSPTTGEGTGNMTVTGNATMKNAIIKSGGTISSEDPAVKIADILTVSAGASDGDLILTGGGGWAVENTSPMGTINSLGGLLLKAGAAISFTDAFGGGQAPEGGMLILIPKIDGFPLSETFMLGNSKTSVVGSIVNSPADPESVLVLNADVVRANGPMEILGSNSLKIGDSFTMDPATGFNKINSNAQYVYPKGFDGLSDENPEGPFIIRTRGDIGGESSRSSWMGFTGTTILSNAAKYFKLLPYNELGKKTVLIGTTDSSGDVIDYTKKYNLAVTGNTTVGGDLSISGAFSPASLNIANDATINGVLNVNNATPGKGKINAKDLSVTGTLTAGTFSPASLAVTGNATVGGTLGVTGTFNPASLNVTGATTVGTTLSVLYGLTTLKDLTVNGTFSPTNLNVFNKTTSGSLSVTNGATLGALEVTGAVNIGDTLDVSGHSTLTSVDASSLIVSGATVVGTTLKVTGASTLTGNTTVGGTLGVTGNTTVGGTLGVTGNTSAGSLSVSGISTLTGNTTVGGSLGVTGPSTLSSLNVTGTLTAGTFSPANLDVANGVTVGTTLTTNGLSLLNGGLHVTGKSTFNGGLLLWDDHTINANVTNENLTLDSSTRTVDIGSSPTDLNVTKDLFVGGKFGGAITLRKAGWTASSPTTVSGAAIAKNNRASSTVSCKANELLLNCGYFLGSSPTTMTDTYRVNDVRAIEVKTEDTATAGVQKCTVWAANNNTTTTRYVIAQASCLALK